MIIKKISNLFCVDFNTPDEFSILPVVKGQRIAAANTQQWPRKYLISTKFWFKRFFLFKIIVDFDRGGRFPDGVFGCIMAPDEFQRGPKCLKNWLSKINEFIFLQFQFIFLQFPFIFLQFQFIFLKFPFIFLQFQFYVYNYNLYFYNSHLYFYNSSLYFYNSNLYFYNFKLYFYNSNLYVYNSNLYFYNSNWYFYKTKLYLIS